MERIRLLETMMMMIMTTLTIDFSERKVSSIITTNTQTLSQLAESKTIWPLASVYFWWSSAPVR